MPAPDQGLESLPSGIKPLSLLGRMLMRNWLASLFVIAAMVPVAAQEISAEADQAMWCITAIQLLDVLGAYPEEAIEPSLLADIWSLVALEEFGAKGFSDDTVNALFESYSDELEMQLPDYLVSGDPDALRHDIGTCLED
jgi:hypothetical protein